MFYGHHPRFTQGSYKKEFKLLKIKVQRSFNMSAQVPKGETVAAYCNM